MLTELKALVLACRLALRKRKNLLLGAGDRGSCWQVLPRKNLTFWRVETLLRAAPGIQGPARPAKAGCAKEKERDEYS